MEYLGKEKFGVFTVGGAVPPLTDKPWFSGNYPGQLSSRGKGDLWVYEQGKDMYIKDSSVDSSRKLTWIHLKEGNKHLYICDRALITNVTWDYLNSRDLIYGKDVTIDGKSYTLRVPTGQEPSSGESEWDKIVVNQANIVGLPKPTAEDLNNTNSYSQLDGEHNQLWNWWGIYSVCQENMPSSTEKVIRGFKSAKDIIGYESDTSTYAMGWRPVLEYTETNPPEKPTIVKPVAPDSSIPYVNETSSVVVETQYNGEDSPFKEMKIEVKDFGGGGETVQSISTPTLTTGITDLKPQTRYQLVIRHVNQAGLISEPVYSYIILGKYGKYKLSEPVTVTRFSKATSYGEPQKLEMKPQSFPETESSKVRLVPETMNSLIATETKTSNKIKIDKSTKPIAVGDKLSIQKSPISILGFEQLDKFEYFSQEIDQITANSSKYDFGVTQGNNATVFGNDMYTVYNNEGSIKIMELDLKTLATREVFRLNSSSEFKDMCITSEGQHMFVVLCSVTSCSIYHFYGYANNVNTREYKFSPKTGNAFNSVDIAMDLASNTVAIAYRESNKTTGNISLYTQEYSILSDGNLSPTFLRTLRVDIPDSMLSHIYVTKYKRGDSTIYGTFYLQNQSNKLIIDHSEWEAGTKNSIGKAGTFSYRNVSEFKIALFSYESDGTYYVEVLTHAYLSGGVSGIYSKTYNASTSSWSAETTLSSVASKDICDLEFNCSRDGKVYALWTQNTSFYSASKDSPTSDWSKGAYMGLTIQPRNGGKLFTAVHNYPNKFKTYPGLLILNFNKSTGDHVRYMSQYSNALEEGHILTLESPVTVKSGEKLYFSDYDLEVKSGEKQANITLDEITPEYYQYNANFGDKEEARDITIKGRNTKLTILYYYNY
ncbi:hypothetical protein PZQ55_002716 [Clostridium botulinum]|nr:hypothetical protein [Clostridium botulinum]EKO2043684.1 hypothetical protein [Clostridium botulinum]